MKLSNLSKEGILTLVSGVLGFIVLLIMFSCSSGSVMSCDNLLGEEKDTCLQDVKTRNDNFRYQMESRGAVE
jgi:hypothetical protein